MTAVRVPPLRVSGARPLEEVVGTEPFGEIRSYLSQSHVRDRGRPRLAGSAHSRGGSRARVPADPDAPSHLPTSCWAPGAGMAMHCGSVGCCALAKGLLLAFTSAGLLCWGPGCWMLSAPPRLCLAALEGLPQPPRPLCLGSIFPDASCPRLPGPTDAGGAGLSRWLPGSSLLPPLLPVREGDIPDAAQSATPSWLLFSQCLG